MDLQVPHHVVVCRELCHIRHVNIKESLSSGSHCFSESDGHIERWRLVKEELKEVDERERERVVLIHLRTQKIIYFIQELINFG